MHILPIIIGGIIIYLFFDRKNQEINVKIDTVNDQKIINHLIEQNNKKVLLIKDEKKIKDIRMDLAKTLDLSKKMYEMYEVIKYYSEDKNRDEPFWFEHVFGPYGLKIKKADRDLVDLIGRDFSKNDILIIHEFKNQENLYQLIFNSSVKIDFSWSYEKNLSKYCLALLENRDKIVYKDNLIFDEHYSDRVGFSYSYFENGNIEIFKPGEWLSCLLSKSRELEIASKKENDKNNDKYEKRVREEIRKNYL